MPALCISLTSLTSVLSFPFPRIRDMTNDLLCLVKISIRMDYGTANVLGRFTKKMMKQMLFTKNWAADIYTSVLGCKLVEKKST